MGQFSMWTRTSLLLSVALWAGRCAESPGLTGTTDAEATEDGDGGAVPLFDSGTEVDALAQSDAEVDSTSEDAALDGSGDGVDTTDVSSDTAGEMGTPCRTDLECASGDCVDLGGGEIAGLCSDICGRDEDCPQGFDCVLVTTSSTDAERRCLPTDYCADGDEDGFGVGPGCSGVDCNDDDAAVNLGVDEVCDGVDNDCDETIDENSADVGDDCSTGFEGVCAPGRTQCVDGGVQCVAFASAADEVCDGLDNDCDGSIDEDVLLEGYRVVDGVCEPVSCGEVPAAPANATLVSVSSTQFGGEVVYACISGYGTAGSSLVDGRVTRVCGVLGDWEPAIGTCTPVDCGSAPAASANARLVSVDRTTLGGTAAYACNEGYGVSSSAGGRYEVLCEASGVWSASATCDPVSCGALISPANGNVSTPGGVEYTDVATYSCNSGYVLTSGSSSRICDLTGAWTGSPAVCTPVSCGGLSNPSNGSVSLPDGSFFGATARYRCDAGFRLAGPETRSCLETGAWSGVATLCEPLSCGPLVNPGNGTVATPDGTEYTDVGVYSCNSGYVLTSGSSSRICDASGSWSGSAAVCTPVDCGALSDPDNGDVVVAGGTSLGATASYTCLDGYALSGSATRTCGVTGAWSGSAPSCAPTSCGAVATVANATASVPSALLGSTATFTCDVGFVPRAGTSNTQTCTGATWVWSGAVLSCDPVNCGPLGNPDNGTVATPDGIAYADVATYACNSGFALTGSPTRTCDLSGLWSGAAPGCAPVDCGAPPTATNGTRTFTSTTYTSVASYDCAEGYTLTGFASSTCTAPGIWTAAPSCVLVSCGALGSPVNGSVSTPTGVEYADVATYACAEGYQIDGTATRTCLATGVWSGVAPGCAPVDCGTLSSPVNGLVSTPSGVTFGATATYSCNSGYVLSSGSSSRICGASGSWSGSAAVCTPVDCGALSDPEYGDVVVTGSTSLGGTANYTCLEGYALSGSTTRTCSVTGAWSGSAPNCAPISCGVVATVANATASVPSALFGSTATFTCDMGFVQRAGTSNTQTCTGAAWVWSGSVLSCDPVSCGPLGNPDNGTVATPDGIAYADVATYACNSGFTLTSSPTRTCQLLGIWSGTAPGCTPVDCGTPPTTTNGTRTFTSTTYTNVASFACAEGYTLTGSATSTCTATGTWTTAPSCVEVSCGVLGSLANGSVITPTGVEYADVATYGCAEGYQINGAATRTCLATGLWSGVAPGCAPVDCGTLGSPANGSVSTSGGITLGATATYSCNSGYVLTSGSSSRICGASGNWSGSAAVCTPVDCGALSDPENGDVVVTDSTSLGATANYTCLEGYALSGSTTRTCGVSGAWSGTAPNCTPTSCGAVATVANATASVPSALFGSTATFTCDMGFVQRAGTSNTQTCTGAVWVWSGSVLSCDQVSCGPLGNPENGTVATPDGITYADVATYACNSGFTLTSSPNRTCQLSGLWSGAAPGCAPVDCGAPPTTTNGTRTFTSTTYTSVASYACAEGYTLTGFASSTCTAPGIWTTAPSCVLVSCGALGSPVNGSVSTPTGVEYADVATYACAEGYQIDGTATRTCLATGVWSGVAPGCAPVDCGTLSSPANGTVSTPSGNIFGSTATYSCNSGYVLTSGSSSRICGASGSWSGSAVVCTAIDCGTPPILTNGTRTFTTTSLDSTASYSCNGGYALSGSATLTCGATGTWGTAPTCADTNECIPAGSVCTAANNVCTNTAGSWQCSCASGYTGASVTGGNATCTLGTPCTADSECPANSWCSTVSGYRRCSPRVFSGAAHQMDFVFVPSGTYQQGTPGATNDERPYTATISRNYFVSRTEVTQGQWKAATGGTNGSCFQSTTGSCTTSNANNTGPVERVDWYSTLAYANWLSVNQNLSACYTLTPSTCADAVSDWATGVTACTGATFVGLTCTGYRLLTESEWERAARGTTTSTYYWGTATDTATVGLYAWFYNNAASRTQRVGGKQANVYGLHDMSGNVWEWVWDRVYSGSAWVSYPSGSATDYIGPSSGSGRGIRGGGWGNDASILRSANRVYDGPSYRSSDVGFRLARTAN